MCTNGQKSGTSSDTANNRNQAITNEANNPVQNCYTKTTFNGSTEKHKHT